MTATRQSAVLLGGREGLRSLMSWVTMLKGDIRKCRSRGDGRKLIAGRKSASVGEWRRGWVYLEGTGGRGRVGGGPGQGGRFCPDMLDSLQMMAIGYV